MCDDEISVGSVALLRDWYVKSWFMNVRKYEDFEFGCLLRSYEGAYVRMATRAAMAEPMPSTPTFGIWAFATSKRGLQ
jgi:hypothetical protein